jgi:hypothetical protein
LPEPSPSDDDPSESIESGVDILVNGRPQTAGVLTVGNEGGRTVSTIAVDEQKLEQKLENEGNNSIVTIQFNRETDVAAGELNGQAVKNMEKKNAVLEIRTESVTYTLPASQINIDDVSRQIGSQVELKDIKVRVEIAEPPVDTVKIVEDTAGRSNYKIIVRPVDFNISCSSGGKTIEVSKFNGYVERTVAIPEGIDPGRITTGVVLNSDGTFSHVPTQIIVIDGKYYAKINSLTNSTYSVIYHPMEFKDVESHWAKEAVNDMGSRLVVAGIGNDIYAPGNDITRAEFSAIVVRALGLKPGAGNNPFTDVKGTDWYSGYIETAVQYDIINGYGNGNFGPDDRLTREQAIAMTARAMNITGLKAEFKADEAEKLLAGFADSADASAFAKDSIAVCIKTGVISGKGNNLLAPKDNITRAEAAAIIQRLLQKSGLI